MAMQFQALGQTIRAPQDHLETFLVPQAVHHVRLVCDEVTSLCPVTGQPDFETVTISYAPDALCIESKSLKLYLWQFRERGTFCEQFAHDLAHAVMDVAHPHWCRVDVAQKPRGGIAIHASAFLRATEMEPAS